MQRDESFSKVLRELKDIVQNHRAGDILPLPPSLGVVSIGGRRVAYASAGHHHEIEGPAVILLHGFGGFFMDWPRVMAPVARRARVYALDLPGWGFSEVNREARSLEDDVMVVREFIRAMGLRQVILCGISYGAGVAWAAAASDLLQVRQVILLNPMPPHPLEHIQSTLYQAIFMLNSTLSTARISHKLLRKSQYKAICRENLLNHRILDTFYLDLAFMVLKQPTVPLILHMHARGARDLDWPEWEHRLAGSRTPVLILQGKQDRIFSIDSARYLHGLIPHARLLEVEDCGHAMVFDQHKKVSDAIIFALKEGRMASSF